MQPNIFLALPLYVPLLLMLAITVLLFLLYFCWKKPVGAILKVIICTVLVVVMVMMSFGVKDYFDGLSAQSMNYDDDYDYDASNPIYSYRGIPGVTEEEINAIKLLEAQHSSFTYGTLPTDLPINSADEFSADLFCEWLTELFGIPFTPLIYEWCDLLEVLDNGTIDFTGELTATEERHGAGYIMTDDAIYVDSINVPHSFATANPELAPIVSVVQKALQVDETRRELSEMYDAGQ